MTVSTTTASSGPYVLGVSPMSVTFSFYDESDLVVIETVIATGLETTPQPVITTDYTVSGGNGSTGTVTPVKAADATLQWLVTRALPQTQTFSLPAAGALPSTSLEQMADRAVMLIQEVKRSVAKKLGFSETSTATATVPDPVASQFLRWNSAATDLENADVVGQGSIGVPIALNQGGTGTAAASAAAALSALGGIGAATTDTLTNKTIAAASNTITGVLKPDVTDTLTKGFNATENDAGTKTTGTFTPDPADGNFQKAVNGGAHTLAPPGSTCSIVIQYTNDGSAGTITTSGFTLVDGSALTTTNGDDFLFFITRDNGFSHLHVKALQ